MADLSVMAGKVVAGDQGDGVLIEDVLFRIDTTKDGEDIAEAEIVGTARTYLKDNYNPNAGFNELPEEVPVKERVKFAMAGGKTTDNGITVERLNRNFNIQPPLVDNDELWQRFLKDGENSVYDAIVGKRAYFSTKLQQGKVGEKPSEFYYNIVLVSKREEATESAVGAKMRAIMAKKKAPPAVSFDPNG